MSGTGEAPIRDFGDMLREIAAADEYNFGIKPLESTPQQPVAPTQDSVEVVSLELDVATDTIDDLPHQTDSVRVMAGGAASSGSDLQTEEDYPWGDLYPQRAVSPNDEPASDDRSSYEDFTLPIGSGGQTAGGLGDQVIYDDRAGKTILVPRESAWRDADGREGYAVLSSDPTGVVEAQDSWLLDQFSSSDPQYDERGHDRVDSGLDYESNHRPSRGRRIRAAMAGAGVSAALFGASFGSLMAGYAAGRDGGAVDNVKSYQSEAELDDVFAEFPAWEKAATLKASGASLGYISVRSVVVGATNFLRSFGDE